MKGFVFGKYLPFHNGHKALIDFALTKCDFLYIVVCASNKEKIDVNIRVNWISDTYYDINNVKIVPLQYNEDELPNTSETSLKVSKIWSLKFLEILPKIDLLITSEDYGNYVADFMNISHILFDKPRVTVPISASKIRSSVYDSWEYLPNTVKRYYQKKFVFSGTECTGKSSISKKLSEIFVNSSLVEEIGREIIENSNNFTQKQLYEVAYKHSENIKTAINELKPFIFIDTDVYVTQSYSKYFFNEYLSLDNSIYELNQSDYIFYLNKDLDFEQDGTRLNLNDRNKLDIFHRNTLNLYKKEHIEIDGNWEDRLTKIKDKIRHTTMYISHWAIDS